MPVPDLAALRRALPPGMAVERRAAADGWPLRRFAWPQTAPAGAGAGAATGSRGGLFFQGGRSDIFEKYLEAFGRWHAAGWSLAGFDWRGHGGSGRFDHRPKRVREFPPAIDDLADTWAQWCASVAGPHVLVAHSMGGYLALAALMDGRIAPDAVVVAAPMWGVRSPLGPALSGRLARWMAGRGDPGRAAWPHPDDERARAARMARLTHDAARHADELWWHDALPGHRGGAPSWAWLAEAFAATAGLADDPRLAAVTVPMLVLVADDDRLVDARAVRRVAARLPVAELVAFGPESAHEILRESDPVRDRALAAIDAFLDRAAPAR